MQIYFHSRLCSYFFKGANISGGHCIYLSIQSRYQSVKILYDINIIKKYLSTTTTTPTAPPPPTLHSVINKKWYKLKSVRSQSCLWSIRAQHLKAAQIQLVQFNSFLFSIQKLWIWGNNKNTQLQSVREEKDKNNNQRPTQMSVCLWVWYRLWWSIDRVVSLD